MSTTTTTGAWVIGSNMPGYLPSGDVYAVEAWEDAWAILRGDMERFAEQDDDMYHELDCGHTDEDDHESECYGSTRALLDAILADGERAGDFDHDTDVSIGLADNDDRVTIFWITWNGEATPDED